MDLRQGFDYEYRPIVEDITTSMGFLTGLKNVVRLRKKGLLAVGLPCDSFGFPASSVHCRSEGLPHGKEQVPFVCNGNMIAYRTVLCILVALVRSVVFFLENPSGSKCTILPVLENLLKNPLLRTTTCRWLLNCTGCKLR